MPAVQTYRLLINRDLPTVERACTSKVRFLSRGEARCVVRHGRRGDSGLKPYHCWNCDGWHLGHKRSRKERSAWHRPAA